MISEPMMASCDNILPEHLSELSYPLAASIKKDGICCILDCTEGVVTAFSRKLLPLPNCHLQEWAERDGIPGLHGELVIPQMEFHDVQSIFMSNVTMGLPINWQFYVFNWCRDRIKPYLQRLQKARNLIDMYAPSHTRVIEPVICHSPSDVLREFEKAQRKGEEGLILADPDGCYKQGRSTRKEGLLLKMKTFEDAEAKIVDFEPEYENLNPKTTDNTGKAKRSSHGANKRARARLGAFVVEDGLGRRFKIGSGYTVSQKEDFWRRRAGLRGNYVSYKFQPHGTKRNGLPRCPIFKGIRID